VDVYLERGSKRVFAGAVAWPGWARAAKGDAAALEALLAYGPRYATALKGTRLTFRAPVSSDDLDVVERVKGTATTDFGAPDVAISRDREEVDEAELTRLLVILRASWRTLERAAQAAAGVELATGPRGGGRSLDKIVDHVLGADASYVGRLGAKVPAGDEASRLEGVRATAIAAVETGVRDGVPEGPRGGKRWTPRYFVRRSAWHLLDHAWEIEDRSTP
jgi:hypothetical protein